MPLQYPSTVIQILYKPLNKVSNIIIHHVTSSFLIVYLPMQITTFRNIGHKNSYRHQTWGQILNCVHYDMGQQTMSLCVRLFRLLSIYAVDISLKTWHMTASHILINNIAEKIIGLLYLPSSCCTTWVISCSVQNWLWRLWSLICVSVYWG